MKTLDGLIDAIPGNETGALGFMDIWRTHDRGAPRTIKHELDRLVRDGAVRRKTIPFSGGVKHLYFRGG